MTSVKSLLRDRSLDRNAAEQPRDPGSGTGTGLPREHLMISNLHMGMARDRSLDRHMDRYRERDMDSRYHTYGGQGHRDRSLDRDKEYPHMGARSLERDHPGSNLTRSRSIDYDYIVNQSPFLPLSQDTRHSRDTLILDMQSQMADLNKECATLQQELDLAKEKVSSSMNSIKTFWSPELKKERSLRKEESAKINTQQEQLRISQTENKVSAFFQFRSSSSSS